MAGDVAAASAALDGYVPRDATEAAGIARMRSVFRARETGVVDMDAIRAATEGLADGERRYQLTSAAFSQAWLDIEAGRPWRSAFAQAVRSARAASGPVARRPLDRRSGAGGTDRRRRWQRPSWSASSADNARDRWRFIGTSATLTPRCQTS